MSLNGWTLSSWPSIKSSLPTMRTDPTHELLPSHSTCTSRGAGLGPTTTISGGASEEWHHAQPLQQRFQECDPSGPPSLQGLKMGEKDQDGGCKLTSQEKDLDRITRQVAAGNKQHQGKWSWVNKWPHSLKKKKVTSGHLLEKPVPPFIPHHCICYSDFMPKGVNFITCTCELTRSLQCYSTGNYVFWVRWCFVL